ncbi:MAG: tRNA adenosine(34) deaminase TadA [Acutalibacteraceae bacterium]|nr:tRNA adenosine(34) deaminase TadA [Acutalibacteraceae bacterium]
MAYNEQFMRRCIELANNAAAGGDVPVGAVVVRNGEIIGEGINRREQQNNPILHAEIEAIEAAAKVLGGWRLDNCDLYVTLEPCPMCAGAIINSRIKNVYFGAYDKKAGSLGSLTDLSEIKYNHKPVVWGGMLQDECANQLSAFFKKLR